MNLYLQKARHYHYLVVDISEGDETGFQAIVPKFPKLHILGDTPQQLHSVVPQFIAEELERLSQTGEKTPEPDIRNNKLSGKFVLRIKPEIHKKLHLLAVASGTSLNQYLNQLIEAAI